jgi:hypothetical protein
LRRSYVNEKPYINNCIPCGSEHVCRCSPQASQACSGAQIFNRLCTDGTKNACSFLYSAASRAAKALGYNKIITYILASESGISLKAAGWKCAGLAGGLFWTGKRKPKAEQYPAEMKLRYEKFLS